MPSSVFGRSIIQRHCSDAQTLADDQDCVSIPAEYAVIRSQCFPGLRKGRSVYYIRKVGRSLGRQSSLQVILLTRSPLNGETFLAEEQPYIIILTEHNQFVNIVD